MSCSPIGPLLTPLLLCPWLFQTPALDLIAFLGFCGVMNSRFTTKVKSESLQRQMAQKRTDF